MSRTFSLPLAWSLARTIHFAVQQRSLPFLEYAWTGRKRVLPPDPKGFFKYTSKKLFQLIQEDADNIKNKIYPASVLIPESPIRHWKRTATILWDGLSIAKRRKQNIHDDFASSIDENLEKFPEYYKRNFHFQTDGYFSDHSADIYEHQVEILFAGTADPMRRLILPLIKKRIPNDGAGLKFLEIGSGTGRLSRFMKLAFPKAQITLLEASDAYLSKSREQLKGFKNIDFVHGFGEDLPFKNHQFDLVYSCFLFHELPVSVRKKVLEESKRVLKPKGLLGFVDSIQLGDDHKMDWALKQFPKDFHEPFYKDYIQRPMKDLLEEVGISGQLDQKIGFFSKALLMG